MVRLTPMSNAPSAIVDKLFEPVGRCLTPDVARKIAALRATDEVQSRLDELADKSTEGTLTAAERQEYEIYVRAVNFIGVLQAQARKLLATSNGG